MEIKSDVKGNEIFQQLFWYAYLNGVKVGVIGILMLKKKSNLGYICHFEVQENYREIGIGSNLLMQALQEVKKYGVDMIQVIVRHREIAALNLYQQAGFIQIASRTYIAGQIIDLELDY